MLRSLLICLIAATVITWVSGCAETGACPDGERPLAGNCLAAPSSCLEGKPVTKSITVGCKFDLPVEAGPVGYFPWELTVTPIEAIGSDDEFAAKFTGVAKFDRASLNLGQVLIAGFRRVVIQDLRAVVQVRNGAQGRDVELELNDSYPRTCTYTDDGTTDPEHGVYTACDPENDLQDGGNTDCTGLGDGPNALNPCLPYLEISTADCGSDSVCTDQGANGPGGPCEKVGFCVTEPAEIPLSEAIETYVPEESGSVLFGWADRKVDGGPEVWESGANRGAYKLEDMGGLSTVTVGIPIPGFEHPIPVRFDCVMGVNSRSADGVGSADPLLSPSPDAVLISCPIE